MAGKILIVDDVATNRILLKVKLSAARYETIQAGSGAEALRQITAQTPDLVLLDLSIPDQDGIALCRRIKATDRAPAVIVLGASLTPEARLNALRAGAEDVMAKPIDEPLLLARLRSLLREREAEAELCSNEIACRDWGLAEPAAAFAAPATIAVVASNLEAGLKWKAALARRLPGDRIEILDRGEALGMAEPRIPDAFVIPADLDRPGDGLRLLSELRSRPLSRHAVVCIATRPQAREAAAVAFDLGADDLMPAAIDEADAAEEAAVRLTQRLERKRRLDRQRNTVANGLRMALTDPLTGLSNRRYALPRLAEIADRARSSGRSFAVMVLDIDRFKAVNDTYGHAAGDAILTEVARRLRSALRPDDLIARIGGEEFLIACPDIDLAEARRAAEQICRAIEHHPFRLPTAEGQIPITMSAGLTVDAGHASASELIATADQALFRSKSAGRNRVTVASRSSAA